MKKKLIFNLALSAEAWTTFQTSSGERYGSVGVHVPTTENCKKFFGHGWNTATYDDSADQQEVLAEFGDAGICREESDRSHSKKFGGNYFCNFNDIGLTQAENRYGYRYTIKCNGKYPRKVKLGGDKPGDAEVSCTVSCRFDKEQKDTATIKCVPKTDENGNVTGATTVYQDDNFNTYRKLCGAGCNPNDLEPFLGPTMGIWTNEQNKKCFGDTPDVLHPNGGVTNRVPGSKCGFKCQGENGATYKVRKPLVCYCEDGDDGRDCSWRIRWLARDGSKKITYEPVDFQFRGKYQLPLMNDPSKMVCKKSLEPTPEPTDPPVTDPPVTDPPVTDPTGPTDATPEPTKPPIPTKTIDDQRNVPEGFEDVKIVFGGGHNNQVWEGLEQTKKTSDIFYGLTATDDPLQYKVTRVPVRTPAPNSEWYQGRYYFCMMHLENNRAMIAAGSKADFEKQDKNYVLEWDRNEPNLKNAKWIDTQGNEMDSNKSACGGEKDQDLGHGKIDGTGGCVRKDEWPDLPTCSIYACTGQCRDGKPGNGPTNPSWINRYCTLEGNFFDTKTQSYIPKTFYLCEHSLVQDNNGVVVDGLGEDKWIAVSTDEDKERFKLAYIEYAQLMTDTVAVNLARVLIYGQEGKDSPKEASTSWKNKYERYDTYSPLLHQPTYNDAKTVVPAWVTVSQTRSHLKVKMPMTKYHHEHKKHGKEYVGRGQCTCGILGDRAYVGGSRMARLWSLARHGKEAAKETTWRPEEGSTFPAKYSKIDNRQCRSLHPHSFGQLIPNMRIGLATATSTEGLWLIGGLTKAGSDAEWKQNHKHYGKQTAGCGNMATYSDVWVFNPKGWTREQVLPQGKAGEKYIGQSDEDILPQRWGFDDTVDERNSGDVEEILKDQTFADFRLSETAGGLFGHTIDSALEEGWECTGVEGKWCRKPFLPRENKGSEATVMCFEPDNSGETEKFYQKTNAWVQKTKWLHIKDIPRRPKVCNPDDTAKEDNKCICYLISISGQQANKSQDLGRGFRPEINYLEIRRADGRYGSDLPEYQNIKENCPVAKTPFENDPSYEDAGLPIPVGDFTECTSECGGDDQPECNFTWKTKDLRRRFHEAGRVRNGRLGFLSGQLKGDIMLFGGECMDNPIRQDIPQPKGDDEGIRHGKAYTGLCTVIVKDDGKIVKSERYIEAFSVLRMNKAGFLFGDARMVYVDGFKDGNINHDEASVTQIFSKLNSQPNMYQ